MYKQTLAILLASATLAACGSRPENPVDYVTYREEPLVKQVENGMTIAEFPTTLEAAEASCQAGLAVLVGAPNLVLGGLDAHDEDRLAELVFPLQAGGEVRLQPVKPCARCPIPDIDPDTATASHRVGDALQTYRQDARVGGAITFGMNAIVLEGDGQMLRVGQRVGGAWRFD